MFEENDPDAEVPPGDPSLAPVLPPSEPTPPPALPVTPVDPLDEGTGPESAPSLPAAPMGPPSLPTAPPAPSIPSAQVATPPAPSPAATGMPPAEVSPDDGDLPVADRLATRNVPTAPPRKPDYGLPTKPVEPSPEAAWVRPDLESMGPPTTALLVGRGLLVVSALLVGAAAQRASGGGRSDVFWPVVVSAGVFALVGVAGLAYWSAALAGNARRLRARCASAKGMAWSWAFPVGWVVISSATYLQFEVDGELDPLPGVAAAGWVIASAIAFGRLQGVFNGLSRTPAKVWFTVFPLDAIAFGLLWWRLTGWPSPVTSDLDEARLTANVSYGAAAILFVSGLGYVWLANKGSHGIFERLGRLEAQHRPPERRPDWFRAGLVARPAEAPAGPVRPLIGTGPLAKIVAALHVLWGVMTVLLAAVVVKLTFDYSDVPIFLADELLIDDDDVRLLVIVGGLLGLTYVAAVVCHGVWAIVTALNARRVTVHAPNPGTFALVFAPMPLLVVAGIVIGGTVGYWLVIGGLVLAFLGLVLANQMLMALSARLGGALTGFSRWSLALFLVHLAGAAQNLLFFQSVAQLGFYATLMLVQGVIIAGGGVVGLRAMRDLEATVTTHKQVARVPDSG
ncbi:MAG: hypothetical protein HKN41_13520 [Ilumatobacter sp.]|nr:hypothetical protein [Ilumatobacter sp.]